MAYAVAPSVFKGRNNSPWQPGQSGNPGGISSHAAKTVSGAIRLAELTSRRAVYRAIEVMEAKGRDGEYKYPVAARLQAIGMILDRALGKPQQAVNLDGGVSLRIELIDPTKPATIEASIVAHDDGNTATFHNADYAPSLEANTEAPEQPQGVAQDSTPVAHDEPIRGE